MKKQAISAWERVQIARDPSRLTGIEYIQSIFDDFIELHGDRYFGDDLSTVTGIATLEGKAYTVIAQQKGRTTKENLQRNFGMPNPEGYRKALRIMKQAEKFNRPIITFIDTKGAYPGIGAEQRGQGEAIAQNLMKMILLKVPILAIIIGEGSSGGALALGVADKVMMLENAIYSILSPEGYASILWKDASKAKEAAEEMKLTAQELKNNGVIDIVIPEPKGGVTLENSQKLCYHLKQEIQKNSELLQSMSVEKMLELRYQKYRKMGEYRERKEE